MNFSGLFSNKISCQGNTLSMKCLDDGQAIAIYTAFFGSKSTPVAECPPRGFTIPSSSVNRSPSLSSSSSPSPSSSSSSSSSSPSPVSAAAGDSSSFARSKRHHSSVPGDATPGDADETDEEKISPFHANRGLEAEQSEQTLDKENKQTTQSKAAKVLEYESLSPPHDSFIDYSPGLRSASSLFSRNLNHSRSAQEAASLFNTSDTPPDTRQANGLPSHTNNNDSSRLPSPGRRTKRTFLSSHVLVSPTHEVTSTFNVPLEDTFSFSQRIAGAEAASQVQPVSVSRASSSAGTVSTDWTCQAPNTTQLISDACVGKKVCNLLVNESTLGSPKCTGSHSSPVTGNQMPVYHLKVTFACVPIAVLKSDSKWSGTTSLDYTGYVAHSPPKSNGSRVTGLSSTGPSSTRGGIEGLRDILAATASTSNSTRRPYPTPFSTLRDVLKNQSSTVNYPSVNWSGSSGTGVTTSFPPYHSDSDRSVSRGNIDQQSASLAAASDGSSGIKLSSDSASKDTSASVTDHTKNKSPMSRSFLSLVNFVKGQ